MQSNVHTFPSAGIRLIPKETPSRRLCIGPKIGDGYITVLMVRCFFLFFLYVSICHANIHTISNTKKKTIVLVTVKK